MLAARVLRGLFWFFSLGVAMFSFAIALGIAAIGAAQVAPHLVHYASDYRVPLHGHIVFGPLALIVAPFQFWTWLRSRHRTIHRTIGYLYASSIAIAGTSSLFLLPRFEGSMWAATGFAVLASLWIFSTTYAVFLARSGQTEAHRTWMMRSAALTFAAVVLRLMTLPLMWTGMTLTQSYDVTAWASWLLPLVVVELSTRRAQRSSADELVRRSATP
jgi:uncharacterized membrane protein